MPGPPELEALVAQVEPVACSKLLLPAILLNRSDSNAAEPAVKTYSERLQHLSRSSAVRRRSRS